VEDNVRGFLDNEWLSDQYMSDVVDSYEEGYTNFATFTMPKTMVDYKWELGTYFTKKEELLEAIKKLCFGKWEKYKVRKE